MSMEVFHFFATLAQSAEQGFCKAQVVGSIPIGGFLNLTNVCRVLNLIFIPSVWCKLVARDVWGVVESFKSNTLDYLLTYM